MKNQDHINGQASKWQPIETAPKTGEHILAAIFDGGLGFGHCGGKQQANYDIVHYWQALAQTRTDFIRAMGRIKNIQLLIGCRYNNSPQPCRTSSQRNFITAERAPNTARGAG
jgi:hypothetical protein